jgi:hypothetical protein
MPLITQKLRMIAAFAALAALALAASCRGFFVNQPNSVTVTTATGASTFSVPPSAQLKAVATYNDGTKDVTKSANWSSSSPCVTVSSTGLVNGLGAASSVTVTALVSGVSSSISGASTGGTGGQTLTITPNTNLTFATNTQHQFSASLNSQDVTSSATWTSSDTSVATFSTTTIGLASFVGAGTSTISASLVTGSSCASGSENITVQ